MNYLITGGTGLIGKAFIKSLSTNTAQITVLTRNVKKAKKLLGDHIHFIEALSLADIENSEVILNLAGEAIAEKRWSATQKDKICKSRWNITQQLTDFIKEAENPPALFISGSAIGVYGRQSSDPIDESYKDINQEFTHHVCATWENIALSAATQKTRVAILRTGIVLAKKDGALAKMIPPFKMCFGGNIGDGQQIMSWIHLDDMVAAISYIEKTPAIDNVINLTAPEAITNHQLSCALAFQLNRPCFFTTPAWLLRLVFGEMAELLLFGQNVIPQKLINAGFSFKYPKINDAFTDIFT